MEAQALLGGKVMVPATVEKLCPGIREKLQAKGANIYVPDNGFAAGSGIGKLAEDFLGSLKGWLGFVLEDMASCNEIEATAGNCMGFVTTALRREEDKENASSHIGHTIAEAICRLRGHDPAIQNKEYIAQTEAHLREVISRRQERSTT
jgi:hypothetical protein